MGGLPHYLVLTDFGALGLGNGADPQTNFRDACNEWSEHMSEGRASVVLEAQINAPLIDVTDAARETVERWFLENHRDLPKWLLDADTDDRAQAGYDAAREDAQERRAA